jgi:hypothetical protein
VLLAWAAHLLAAPAAHACPVCHSPDAERIRALLGAHLEWSLLATVAPIALVLALVPLLREVVGRIAERGSDGERPESR